jgi:hypothetical protein
MYAHVSIQAKPTDRIFFLDDDVNRIRDFISQMETLALFVTNGYKAVI